MPQTPFNIMLGDEVATPLLTTALEVIPPVRSSGFLPEPGGGDNSGCHRHHVGALPGLQAGHGSLLCCQSHQFPGALIESSRIPQSPRVAAHGLLHGGNHRAIDEPGLSMIFGRWSTWRKLLVQLYRDPAGEDQSFEK